MTFINKFSLQSLSAWFSRKPTQRWFASPQNSARVTNSCAVPSQRLFRPAQVLACFVFAWFATSCNQASIVGQNLVSKENAQVFEIDTFTVEGSSMIADSIISDATVSDYMLVGQYNDPALGKVKARSFVSFSPSTDPLKLPDDTENPTRVLDSVVFVLGVESLQNNAINLYPDHQTTQHFFVHQLKKPIDSIKTHYTFDSQDIEPDPLARVEVNIQKLKEDKVVRINLTTSSFIKGNVMSDTIKSLLRRNVTAQKFKEEVKGFALVPDETSGGNVIGFVKGITSNMLVYYTATYPSTNGLPNRNERGAYVFGMNAPHYNNIQADRTGTVLQSLTSAWQPLSSKLTQNQLFLQAGLGVYGRLHFPTLKNLKNLGNVIINKAVLTMKTSAPILGSPTYLPVSDVFLYKGDANNKLIKQTVNNVTSFVRVPLDGSSQTYVSYNSRDGQYEIPISRYAQFLMSGDEKEPYIIIIPANNNFTVDRSILGNTTANSPNKIRLRVFYTVFK